MLSTRELLSRIELFSSLDDSSLAPLANIAIPHTHPAGAVVVRQGERDANLYAIADGLVQVSVQAVDGREIVLSLLRQGDAFGELTLFDGKTRSATVTTLKKSSFLVFTRDDLVRTIRQYPDVGLSMLGSMAALVRRLTTRAEELSALPVPQRLAKKLLELAELCGTRIGPNHIALPAALSQQQLANHIQATRESVNKNLSGWIKDSVLQRTHSQIIILDQARLAALVHGNLTTDSPRPADTTDPRPAEPSP